jgi:hypothetical protein
LVEGQRCVGPAHNHGRAAEAYQSGKAARVARGSLERLGLGWRSHAPLEAEPLKNPQSRTLEEGLHLRGGGHEKKITGVTGKMW